MNFSVGGLLSSMLVSSVGLVFFRYGRKKSRTEFWGVGLVMMIYPYFIDDVYGMLGIGAALCLLLYFLSHH